MNTFTRDSSGEIETKHKIKKSGSKEKAFLDFEIENFSKHKFKIYAKPHRKLKAINIFRLVKERGVIVKQFSRRGIKYYKKFFNIKKTNRVVGFTPFYIGFRKSSPVTFKNYYHYSIFNNFLKIKQKFPNVYKSIVKSASNFREVYSGSPDSNTQHLKQFFSPNSPQKFSIFEKMEIVLKSNFLKAPELEFNDPREIPFIVNYNPKASSGLMTRLLTKSNGKSNTIHQAVLMAMHKAKIIRQKPMKNYSLWEILAREKDFKIDGVDNIEKFGTRVVMNPEHHESLLLSWVFQKLMISYESFYKGDPKFLIKGEYDGVKAGKILKRVKQYDWFVASDWTFFDASNDTDDLILAGALMFSNSIKDKSDLRFFFHIISSFVTKYIAAPPGIVVELNRGNPSGHPGVTAVNCFCNLIRWSLIGYMIYGERYSDFMDLLVYGDDTLVMFKEHPNLNKIDDIIKDLGYKGDLIKDELYPCSWVDDTMWEGPDFLKRKITSFGISWNVPKIIDKLLYQSKKRSLDEQIDVLVGFVETAPCNQEFNDFSKFIIKDIITSQGLDVKDYSRYFSRLNSLNKFKFSPTRKIEPIDNIRSEVSFVCAGTPMPKQNYKLGIIDKELAVLKSRDILRLFVTDISPSFFNLHINFFHKSAIDLSTIKIYEADDEGNYYYNTEIIIKRENSRINKLLRGPPPKLVKP